MEMFINIIQAISDNRYWLMPILLFCIVVVLAVEVSREIQTEIEGFRD